MFKRILLLFLIISSFFILSGCNSSKYKEEAGKYELYSMTGDLNMSMYKSYTIELQASGTFTVKTTYTQNTQIYEGHGTFSIEDEKIKLISSNGDQTVTEEYDYIDNEIIMDTTISGYTFVAKFKRTE